MGRGEASPETGSSAGDVLEDTGERPKLQNGSTDGQCSEGSGVTAPGKDHARQSACIH